MRYIMPVIVVSSLFKFLIILFLYARLAVIWIATTKQISQIIDNSVDLNTLNNCGRTDSVS